MGWIIYQTSFGSNNNGWHYASIGGTYNGLTTGLNASGTSLTFYGFNSQAGGGFDQKPVFYIQNNPIKFSNKKTYLFETAITNFESSNVQNKITIKLSHFSPAGVDGWQGRSKYIEYGPAQVALYPPGNTKTSAVGNDVSTTKTLIYQFFSKPTETFFSPKITESYSSLTDGKYAIAEFLATKKFGDKTAQVTHQTRTYPTSPTNNDMCLLKNFSVSELDFQVQGWAVYKEENYLTDLAIDEVEAIGWAYFNGTYSWRVSSTQSGVRLNAMGPVPDSGTYSAQVFNDSEADMVIASNTWTVNNFIGLPIEDGQIFNIQFDVIFSTQSGPNLGPDLKLYLSNELPTKYTVTPQRGLLVGTFTESNRYYYYNLNGGSYLYFVGGTAGTPGLNFVDIGNISIRQGYSLTNNNKQFAFQSELSPYSEPTQLSILGADPESTYTSISITDTTVHETDNGFVGAKKLTYTTPPFSQVRSGTPITSLQPSPGGGFTTITIPNISFNSTPTLSGFSTVGFFSNVFGTVSNLTEIRSKAGNGTFKAGVWENGVWNSGWRVDQNVHEFNDISLSFNLKTENVRWRIQIEGPTYSVANFEIGDRISIGNIVTIDINEKRKLLKNYFTIVNKNETTLIVEVDNVFPIRRIQKDSPNHKILITKNVWLNGGFLNGYFQGIWNDGLFKGYPYITEMYNSHWIDGKFDGGHFYATKPSFKFEDTYYWEGYVGLTFGSVTHSYLPGDLITINKDDKSVNPQYDGDHKITKIIDEHLVVTDIQWGENTANETGIVTRRTSTGLIQNFKFYDNNKSTKTSRDTRVLKDLWRYCSWIDVNYSNQSTTNINSDRIYNNKSTTNFLYWRDRHQFGIGDYAVLNLYGFITEDVLSSESYFRGLDSVSRRPYSLGTKYEIYQDFLGDISNFNSPFDTDPELGTLDNFFTDGWTWSFSGTDGGTYSYVNNLITTANSAFIKRTDIRTNDPQAPTQLYGGTPTWSIVPFQTTIEDTFGLLITASTSNNEWTVNTNGIYNINIEIPSTFDTDVVATPLESGIDNDYLFLTGNVTVGQLRLVKYSNGTTSVLSSKTIKTSGGDFNVGTDRYDEGQSLASYSKILTLFIDWKGNLQIGDKVRLEFQSCQLAITNYNSAGPWRGSGFEQGFPFYDNIIYVKAEWSFNSSRTLSISNSGVNNSLGFNMKRTSDGTLLVEHLENSFHSLTLNNNNIKIAKNRYSMIEFDLIQSPETSYQPLGESYSFHWTDLYNFTTFINRDLSYSNQPAFPGVEILDDTNIGGTLSSIRQNPIGKRALWSGIDYTKTIDTKKREFFYNRPGLDLGLLAEQRESFREQIHELDNIKFYEVDMIPFFQYTTEEYVDSGIKIPYQGKAPFIDYTDSDFSFVESVVIGLDSVDLQETSTTYVPQGITPFIFTPPPPPSFTLTPLSGINSNNSATG